MATGDGIAAVVEPVLTAQGLRLYDVELTGATVRVLIDGVTLEDLERVSPLVSSALDQHFEASGEMAGRWYLEVSSPGLERPLRRPEHFRSAVGTKVKVKTRPGVEGDRRLEGALDLADDEGIVVGGRRLAYGELEQARTVFEWGADARSADGKVKR